MKTKGFGSSVADATKRSIDFVLTEKELAALGSAANVALTIIAGTGMVAVSAVAPNIFKAVGSLWKIKNPHSKLTHQEKQAKTTRTFYYLKESGLVQLVGVGAKMELVLTEKGKKKYDNLVQKRKELDFGPWDGRLWLIAADIPTKDYRPAADAFRNKLRQLNFYPLQRTLWVYPFNPCEMIQQVTIDYHIQNFVTVMEVRGIDKDDEVKIKDFFKKIKMI